MVLAALILPFLPLPPIAAWRYLLTSAGLNTVYFVLIAEAYTRGGVALAYPLMRGTAPMLTALAPGSSWARCCHHSPGRGLLLFALAWLRWHGDAAGQGSKLQCGWHWRTRW
jgi:hypothetical protein